MMMSHMEPNVILGEAVDVSAAFNYGFPDAVMNNFWVYDFNMLEDTQNHLISGLPVQESPVYASSDPALSFSRLLANMEHNRENDDPNTVKVTNDPSTVKVTNDPNTVKVTNFIESKATQKSVKGPRSKRCKRSAFESSWKRKGHDLYGSVDNRETDASELTFKKQKGQDLYGSVDNQETGHGEPTFEKQNGYDLHGSVDNKETCLSETRSKKQKGKNRESNDIVSESVSVNGVGRWLEDLGFGRYASMFEMHEVDEEALPLLTLDDLKEMGVLAVGSRRKLYAAICRLKGK